MPASHPSAAEAGEGSIRFRPLWAVIAVIALLLVGAGVAGCGDAAQTAAPSSAGSFWTRPTPTPTDRWWPLIERAARANGIDPLGLHRLMIAESDGQADQVTAGMFHGLFQYVPETWRGDWNPWRTADIYDGPAQIKATALAIGKGKGPYWWPNTYGPAFGEQ